MKRPWTVRRLLAVLGLSGLGCEASPLAIDIADGEVFAAVALSETGEWLGASGLVGPREGPVFIPPAPAHVVAPVWPIEAPGIMAGLGRPEPLEPATGCAPALPSPLREIVVRGSSPNPLPAMTARWLEDACPGRDGTPIVEFGCRSLEFCVPAVARTGRCSFDATLTPECGGSTLKLRFGPAGDLCVQSEQRCTPPEEPLGAFDCELISGSGPVSCPVRVIWPPEEPPLEVDRWLRLHDLDPEIPGFGETIWRLPTESIQRSLAPALALTSSRAVVLGFQPLDRRGRARCPDDDDVPVRLHAFDLDTLEPVGGGPVPPCTAWLAATPAGLVIAYPDRDQNRWRLARVGLSGAISSSVVLDHALDARLIGLRSTGDAVLVTLRSGRTTVIERVGLDLSPAGAPLIEPGRPGRASGANGWIVVGVESPEGRFGVRYGGSSRQAADFEPNRALYLPDADHDPATEISVYALSRDLPGVGFWPVGGNPTRSVRLPPFQVASIRVVRPGLALFGGIDAGPGGLPVGVVGRADLPEGRLLLGDLQLGASGPVTEVEVDAKGRPWVLLGWSGRVARLRVR